MVVKRGRPKKQTTVIQKSYVAFRIGNDNLGKYRYWTQRDEGYGSFSHAGESTINKIREVCNLLQIPVYYFDLDDDKLEDATILYPYDKTPVSL